MFFLFEGIIKRIDAENIARVVLVRFALAAKGGKVEEV